MLLLMDFESHLLVILLLDASSHLSVQFLLCFHLCSICTVLRLLVSVLGRLSRACQDFSSGYGPSSHGGLHLVLAAPCCSHRSEASCGLLRRVCEEAFFFFFNLVPYPLQRSRAIHSIVQS